MIILPGRWCPGADLNHRHADFQSTALPTELPGHRIFKKIGNIYFESLWAV